MLGSLFPIMVTQKTKGRSTMADWAKIKAEYIKGGISTRKLAEKHCVSYTTIARKCRDEKWTAARQQAESRTTEKIVEACAAKEAKKVNKIDVAAELLLDQVARLAENKVLTTKQLRELASTLKDIRDIKGVKTEADLREQEARIRKLERDASGEDADNELQIIMPDSIQRYCK